jgi:hypothetical protein
VASQVDYVVPHPYPADVVFATVASAEYVMERSARAGFDATMTESVDLDDGTLVYHVVGSKQPDKMSLGLERLSPKLVTIHLLERWRRCSVGGVGTASMVIHVPPAKLDLDMRIVAADPTGHTCRTEVSLRVVSKAPFVGRSIEAVLMDFIVRRSYADVVFIRDWIERHRLAERTSITDSKPFGQRADHSV